MSAKPPQPFRDFVKDIPPGRFFPCVPGGKAPLTPNGHHDATDDPAQLRAWADQYPDANVGFDPDSLGLSVIDIDGQEGEAEWAVLQIENDEVPETATVHTPGGGRHLYFQGRLPTTAGKLAPHIDTRGSGTGYVLIPPSVTAKGTYRYG